MRHWINLNVNLIIFLLCFSHVLSAREYQGHTTQGNDLIVKTEDGQLILSFLTPESLQVSFETKTVKNSPSVSLIEQAESVAAVIDEQAQQLSFSSHKLTAVINKSPLQIKYYQGNDLLLSEADGFFIKPEARGVTFELQPNEKLLGGGERVLGMDRRGHRLPLYNKAHYGYGTQSNQMNYGLPAVYSSQKYVLLFDNAAKGWLDAGKTQPNILSFEAVAGRLAYVVVSGQSYADIVSQYANVTGHQPMPPRWALGYIASRFGYHSEQEARDTVKLFNQENFPLDAIIFDLYWFGKDIQGHMGNLDWDKTAFPNPVDMIADFKQQGINTVLITEPFILTTSNKWQDAVEHNVLATNENGEAKTFDFYFGNTGLVDIFNPKAQTWFWDNYKRLMQQGVEGWWGDLGEPEVHPADTLHTLANQQRVSADEVHNAYGHEWAKVLYQNQMKDFPNKRPFILMRSGFAGSQRYGMIPWTGDVSRSWDGLKPQVELSLQMGLMGLAYTHSDLGGFAGDHWDEELYLRWLQYGVFQPIYRPHAQEAIAPEPVFHSDKVKNILRNYVALRYQLMPYNYTLAFDNANNGLPLMRPLFFSFDEAELNANPSIMDNAQAYLWGDAFLVSPITAKGVKRQDINLPKGVWFDYWTDQKYLGGQTQTVPVDLETMPILVKAGAFVPMVNEVNNAAHYSSQNLFIHYYHHPNVLAAVGKMYDDDGKTPNAFIKGEYEIINMTAQVQKKEQSLLISMTHQSGANTNNGQAYQGMPTNRRINLVVHNVENNAQAVLNDILVRQVQSQAELDHFPIAAWYNKITKQLTVSFDWSYQKVAILVR